MTPDQPFRTDPAKRIRLTELLSDPVLQEAFVVIQACGTSVDAPVNADAIASVRILSQQNGWREALQMFPILTLPNEPEAPVIEEDWGVTTTTP